MNFLTSKTYKLLHNRRGFTLIEIMVAVSIFAVVAVIATGALITASDINKKAQAIKLAVDNVNFALNKMVFEIRNGNVFGCPTVSDPSTLFYNHNSSADQRNCALGSDYDALFMFTYRSDCTTINPYTTSPNACGNTNDKTPVAYKLKQINGRGEIQYSVNPEIAGTFIPVTSSEVDIETLKFEVDNNNNTSAPRVRVVVSGVVAGGTKHETIFDLQTTATARGN